MMNIILAAMLSLSAVTTEPADRCGWEATPCVLECLDMCTGIAGCLDVCVENACDTLEAIPVMCE